MKRGERYWSLEESVFWEGFLGVGDLILTIELKFKKKHYLCRLI